MTFKQLKQIPKIQGGGEVRRHFENSFCTTFFAISRNRLRYFNQILHAHMYKVPEVHTLQVKLPTQIFVVIFAKY